MGMIAGIERAAPAVDAHNAIAMLVRREGETISALLRRLNKPVFRYCLTDEPTDVVNSR